MTDRFTEKSDGYGSSQMFILACKQCGQTISGALRQVQGAEQFQDESGEPALSPGCFAICGDVRVDEACYGAAASDLLASLSDLLGLEPFGPRVGCCGPSDHQLNLRCMMGHPLGIEVSDCWTPHFVHFPIDRITLEPAVNVDS